MSDHDHKPEIDAATGVGTTGHEWDGVKELNNPLPRWWLSIFYISIIWAVGYMIAYPAWPMVSEATRGVLGYSSRAELAEEMQAAAKAQSQWRDQIRDLDLTEISASPELSRFATRAGKAAFAVNCSQCHGSGAQGAIGYPNLNDDDWIWGGALEEIHDTIRYGVRNDSDDARYSEMPAFSEMLEPKEIKSVAQYVLSLSGLDHDPNQASQAVEIFADNCADCHGEKGEGDVEMGAPKLADAIWLFRGDSDSIIRQISTPSHGVMPAWGEKLSPTTIKELTIYVHSLGGGQ